MDETIQLYAATVPSISRQQSFPATEVSELMSQFPDEQFLLTPDSKYYENAHSETMSDRTDSSDSSSSEESDESESSGYSDWEDEFPFEENVMSLSRTYQFMDRLSTSDSVVVYKAFHKKMKKKVVIKILDEEVKSRHPRIVRILSVIQGCKYLPQLVGWHNLKSTNCMAVTTEYISSDDIEDYCDGDAKRIQRVMFGIASAVSHLHTNNIIHRDIKPGNVLWDGKKAILIDFDLSTFYDEKRLHRWNSGTPGFKAPEVGKCKGYGKAIDIYSMGMVMAFLLLKASDYDVTASKPKITAKKIRKTASKNKNPTNQLLLKMLRNDPKNRPVISEVLAHKYFDELR